MTSFRLEFDQGGQLQQASFHKPSITIGRDRGSDFVLDHPTVSRQHALIVDEGGGRFKLVVLSRGGLTAVDGQPVKAAEVQLYDGTELTFGQYTVRFRSAEAPPKQSGPSPTAGSMGAAPSMGASPSMGGSMPSPGQAGSGGPGASSGLGAGLEGGMGAESAGESEESSAANDAGIMSWDEIAASSESEDGEEDESGERGLSDLQRMRRQKQSKDEETNPVVVIGALLAAVALLFVAFSSGSDDGGVVEDGAVHCDQEEVRLEVSVSCLDEATCRQEAEHNYERGIDLIRSRAVETGNLFEGYERLLKAQAYLREAGIDEIPPEMDQWHEKHDMARDQLNERYREFLVRFHQAEQRGRAHEMAEVIDRVQANFPTHTACENRWARNAERNMKSEGIYPR